jgi:ribonuclease R
MRKRLRKPVKKEKDFSEQIIKILSQSANKAFNYKQIEQSWSLMIRKAETKL